jgi:hypothetical protein
MPRAADEARFWIGVAACAHVRIGVAGGFRQHGHGKPSPLKRLRPGPGHVIVCCAPSELTQAGDKAKAFTAIGRIGPGELCKSDMAMREGTRAFRRGVAWFASHEAPISLLTPLLSFIADKTRWAGAFRFGLVAALRADGARIAAEMGVSDL